MSAKQLSQLPQLFRSPFLRKVALGNFYQELEERLTIAGLSDLMSLRLKDIFQSVYQILLQNYRCEYVFKNELIRNWLKSHHSLKKSYLTDEFRVGTCRVDLAVFSATSVAFEIKTEFDSALRLASQSSEYVKLFDLVYVVTTEDMLRKLNGSIAENVGILTLESCGGFKTRRDSRCHAGQTDIGAAFNCLRQGERLAVVEKSTGVKVMVPTSRAYG